MTTATAPASQPANFELLSYACRVIAGRCDHAFQQDGAGFNKFDADFGHRMADTQPSQWTARQARGVWRMLRKYRGQLAGAGINYDELPEPPDPESEVGRQATRDARGNVATTVAGSAAVTLAPTGLRVAFPYDAKLVGEVRRIAGARWQGDAKVWELPARLCSVDALAALGFDVDAVRAELATRPDATKPVHTHTIHVEPAATTPFIAEFPYDEAAIAACRAIPGAHFDRPSRGWRLPASDAGIAGIERLCQHFGFVKDAEVDAYIAKRAEELARLAGEQAAAVAASKAVDADIRIDTMKVEPFPFQRAGIAYALDKRRTFIADEQGLGKTVQAIGTLEAGEAFPALVVCPATLKPNWKREVKRALPHRSVEVVGSSTFVSPFIVPDVTIINYDILQKHLDALKARKFKAVVFDESHLLKNKKTQRTQAALEIVAGEDVDYRLLLTGTPVLNRPIELASQLEVMGRIEDFGGWYQFARRYAGAHRNRFGLDTKGAAHLDELNVKLRSTCFIRRLKADVLTELPAKQKAEVPIEIDNRPEYTKAETDVIEWLRIRAAEDADFRASIADLPKEEQARLIAERAESAAEKARRAETLVRINALKKLAVAGKMRQAIEWIENFLVSGEKLVVFAWHTEVIRKLAEWFNAPTITGETSIEDRQAAVDRFQSDPECKVIVLNMQAGGVGITLTAASNVAFIEYGWTPALHEQAEDRTHRIGQVNQVTAWYLSAVETIDEDISALIEEKRHIVAAATDGAAPAKTTSILSDVVKRLIARGEAAA